MEYILGARGEGCIFCAFPEAGAGAHRKNLVLVVQEHALACLNLYPFTSGHLLVAPRRHVGDLAELPRVEYTALMDLLGECVTRLKRAVTPEGINVGFNLGKAAGAGIADHLHGHIVPRWLGDTNFMPVVSDVRVMPEYLDEAWRRLYPHFADLPGERGLLPR
jgi:ATP adenylyltransferase